MGCLINEIDMDTIESIFKPLLNSKNIIKKEFRTFYSLNIFESVSSSGEANRIFSCSISNL